MTYWPKSTCKSGAHYTGHTRKGLSQRPEVDWLPMFCIVMAGLIVGGLAVKW